MSENHPTCSSVKWEVVPLSCPRVFWMQAAWHSHMQVASIYGEDINELPGLMIPIPAALVCPKTRDTVAENACNIASHLSIDRTHDKGGILRQSWSRHVREYPSCSSVKWEVIPLCCPKFVWMQSECWMVSRVSRGFDSHLNGKSFFETRSQAAPCHIASHISNRTHDKRRILRQSWSTHVTESPKLFKCEVRSHSFLLFTSFLDAINRAQPQTQVASVYGEGLLVEHSWIAPAHDSYPSSICLSQDIWHCGRRCL